MIDVATITVVLGVAIFALAILAVLLGRRIWIGRQTGDVKWGLEIGEKLRH